MNGKTVLCIALVITGVIVLAGISLAQATVVEVDGYGQTYDDAVLDAQRTAVSVVMGQYVDSRTLVQNFALLSDRILTSSSGYVKAYEVIEEGQVGGSYRVRIRAEVASTTIRDNIDAIAVLQAHQGNPRFVVVPDPNPLADHFRPGDQVVLETQRAIESYLAERQMNVVQAPMGYGGGSVSGSAGMLRDLSQYSAGLGAEYAVYFSVKGSQKGRSRTFNKATVVVSVNIVNTGSYRIFAQEEGRSEAGDDTDMSFAFQKAASDAARKAMHPAMDKLLADWSRAGTTAGATYTLNLEQVQGDDLEKFEEALNRSGAVKQVDRRSFVDGTAQLHVTVQGAVRDLGDAVGIVLQETGLDWTLVGFDGSSLTYRTNSIILSKG